MVLLIQCNLSDRALLELYSKPEDYICFNFESKEKGGTGFPVPPWVAIWQSGYIIFAKRGTISSETMLMILIIGLTAGPAVSL